MITHALGRIDADYRAVAETAVCRRCGEVGMVYVCWHERDGSVGTAFRCPKCEFWEEV